MRISDIKKQIEQKQSLLCVGLDPVMEKLPEHIQKTNDPLFNFCKEIVDATHQYAIAFKPNVAFFEAYGSKGWQSLEKLADYIKTNYPSIFLIADAKRGDIMHSSAMYAKAFFDTMPFDAVTINPLLGKDVVAPFLEYKEKFVILLGLSSNPTAYDLQLIQELESREYIFEKIFKYGTWWGTPNQIMYVVGATMAYKLQQIRYLVKDYFLLIPGIGAQGGDLQEVCDFGLTENYGLIINSSRSIIYAGKDKNFTIAAAQKAAELQKQMAQILQKFKASKKKRKRF